jgi:hypothetical protein
LIESAISLRQDDQNRASTGQRDVRAPDAQTITDAMKKPGLVTGRAF